MNAGWRDLPRMLEGLNAVAVAARDASLFPACTLAAGVTADDTGRVTVYVPEAIGKEIFEGVAANGRIAVVLEYIPTHRSVQVKGRCLEMRPAEESEREIVDRPLEAFFRDVQVIGAPDLVRRRRRWPCRAITFQVEEVYEQTPGPRAGLPIGAGGAP